MRSIRFIILFLIIANLTSAQQTKTKKEELKHGIQFQIGSLLTLNNFNNYTLSYRYNFDSNSGIRIGILTDVNNNDEDVTVVEDTISLNPNNYSHSYNYKLSLQYLFNAAQYKNFYLFLGGGPFISITKNEFSSEYIYSSYISKSKYDHKSTAYGLDLLFGAEYKPLENIAISGEYGVTFSGGTTDVNDESIHDYYNSTQDEFTTENGKIKNFEINSLGVKLGLTVFF